MNAINLLMADHKEVERMFEESEGSGRSEKKNIFHKIKVALEAHAYIEETIFYPTLQAENEKDLIKLTSEAIQEHMDMKCILGELSAVATDASRFEPLLKKLIEDVRHHVKEEEGEMFPAVEERFSGDALKVLGERMESEKQRYLASTETIYG